MAVVAGVAFVVGKYYTASTWLVGTEVASYQTGVQWCGRDK